MPFPASTHAAPVGAAPTAPRVLADALPTGRVTDALAVLAGAAAIGLCAQVSLPLPGTPVPLTLQTFAVLLVAAALGPVRGVAATLVYLGAGVAGVPWFAPGAGAASVGYLVGFVGCAALVGGFARRGMDRTVARTAVLMAAGDLVILLVGASGLVAVLHLRPAAAVAAGIVPFLVGDAVKVVAAAVLLPAAWRLVGTEPR